MTTAELTPDGERAIMINVLQSLKAVSPLGLTESALAGYVPETIRLADGELNRVLNIMVGRELIMHFKAGFLSKRTYSITDDGRDQLVALGDYA